VELVEQRIKPLPNGGSPEGDMRRLLSRLDLFLPIGLLALALGRVQARSAIQDFIGRQLPVALPRLLPGAATALVALLAPLPLALAFCLWRQRRGPGLDTADRLVVMATFPLILLGSLFAGLLAAGGLSPGTFFAGLALLAAAGLATLAGQLRLARPAPWRETLGPPLWSAVAANALLLFGGLLSLHLGQDYNFDLRFYHYFNVYAWFNGSPDLRLAVADRMGFFNPLCDVPAYVLIQRLPPVWVGFVLGAAQSLPAVFAFALAYKALAAVGAFGPRPLGAALLCAIAGAFEPTCVTELGGTMSDNALAALVLASLTAVVVALTESPDGQWRRRLAWLAVAGALAGLAAGLKLTLSTFCVAGAAAVFVATRGWKGRVGATAAYCAAVVAGFLATNGYWMWNLYRTVGSPTFPFFNSVFRSPYFPAVEMPIADTNGPWPWRLLTVPFAVTSYGRHSSMEVPFADVRLALLLVLAPVAVTVSAWRARRGRGAAASPMASRVTWLLAAFGVVSYLIWDERFFIVRYCSPLMVAAPLLAVLLLRSFVPRGRALLVAAAVACFLVVGGMKVSSYGRVRWTDDFLQVEARQLDVPPGALVIVTWQQSGPINPNTQLLTLFPRDTVFFNLDSQILKHARGREEAEALVATHPGPIYLLSNPCATCYVAQDFRRFGLRREGDPVGHIEAVGAQLELWKVERVPDEKPSPEESPSHTSTTHLPDGSTQLP
jgi:hypothetical protein